MSDSLEHTIADQIDQVKAQIAQATAQAGRAPGSVQLLAVSKTFPAQAVRAAAATGQTAFGENYVQEAVEKIQTLADLPQLEWHCIGPLQSRKTGLVAQHFAWLHSLDRLDIAQRLSRQRPEQLPPLQVCLQVNMDGGANKSGLAPADVLAFAQQVVQLPQLQLRGLMSIPEPYSNPADTLAVHQQTKALFDSVGAQLQLPHWDTLSMGMSGDMDLAIAAGSTMVRVGTAIFGHRPAKT